MSLPRTWNQPGQYFIPLRLQLLTRMIEREMSRDLNAASQLSVAEWRVLAMTCAFGPVSAADVAAAFEADAGQISRAVAGLLERRLIERESVSRVRNQKRITSTSEGWEIYNQIQKQRQAYFETIMRDLSSEDLAALDHLIGRIAARVDEERTPPGER